MEEIIKQIEENFDWCIGEAIKMGRKHMPIISDDPKPTKEEWELALVLFENGIWEKLE